jgi:hypothetical protein
MSWEEEKDELVALEWFRELLSKVTGDGERN